MAKDDLNKTEKNNTQTTKELKLIIKIKIPPLDQNLLRKSTSKCGYCEGRFTKGQLISKCLFDVLNFQKKQRKI